MGKNFPNLILAHRFLSSRLESILRILVLHVCDDSFRIRLGQTDC